jgi:cytosine/uracil/thiamine/allantoin permease
MNEERKPGLKQLHFAVGLLGIVLFLASGMYMRYGFNGLKGMKDLPRMLFRSSHIYLLLTSLINLSFGLYESQAKRWSILQSTGSILILISPFLMVLAFLKEPGSMSFSRTFAGPGIYAVFGGTMLHLLSASKN